MYFKTNIIGGECRMSLEILRLVISYLYRLLGEIPFTLRVRNPTKLGLFNTVAHHLTVCT